MIDEPSTKRIHTHCMICKTKKPAGKKAKTKTCSKECWDKLRLQVAQDPEIRSKISKSRKEYLKKHPDSFPWTKDTKFLSVPCEHFKKRLKEAGIEFVEEFQPLDDRFFRIDICFPEHKLGIEINGSQHYESGGKQLRPYYQNRHNLISQAGWKLLEVYHKNVWNDAEVEKLIEIVKQTLDNVPLTHYRDFSKKQSVSKSMQKKAERQARLDAGVDPKWYCKLDCNPEKLEDYKKALNEAGPGTYGWITRASKAMNVSHTQIRRVIQNHFPELI